MHDKFSQMMSGVAALIDSKLAENSNINKPLSPDSPRAFNEQSQNKQTPLDAYRTKAREGGGGTNDWT